MAEAEAREPAEHDPVEALIDDLIRDILTETGQSTKARARGGDPMAALIEKAIATTPSQAPRVSTIEKLLLAQTLATTLAEALAPALAENLAPEIMKALEHYTGGGQGGQERASTSRSSRK